MVRRVPDASSSSQSVKLETAVLATVQKESSRGCWKAVMGGSSFFIPIRIFLSEHLTEGQSLSELEFNQLKSKCEFEDCCQKALGLLSIREHSRFELKQKLTQRAFSSETISSVLDALEEEGSLDEVRFCSQLIISRCRKKPEGRALMEQRLLAKGACRDSVRQALDEIYTEEFTREQALRAYQGIIRRETETEKIKSAFFKAGFNSYQLQTVKELL